MSVPSVALASPHAAATAEPLDEPPGERSAAHGFRAALRVGMVGDERELGHVELAEQDRARLLEPFDGGRSARRHVAAEDAR